MTRRSSQASVQGLQLVGSQPLRALEELSVEETAVILGCSKDAVKVRLHRARQLFKALVSERCEISTERGGEVSCVPKGPVKEVRS